MSGFATPRIVRCPVCGGDSVYGSQNAFRPFCSRRCRSIDFGTWASEGYRVSGSPSDAESQREDNQPRPPH